MSLQYSQVPLKAVTHPTPFHISIPETELAEFRALLKLSKIGSPTYENLQEDQRFGVSSKWLTEAKDHWENQFDWRVCEDRMNSFPNFMMQVDTGNEKLDIHFAALFSEREDAVPVVFFHGWPGSFLEFLPLLSLMKNRYSPKDLPYHIIVPSLPGYAFSSAPPLDKNFTAQDVASLMNQLMLNLGFEAGYVAQGGDIGSRVTRILAVEHESCKAALINFCNIQEPKDIDQASITDSEREGLAHGQKFINKGTAYALEHGTRPSTIGLVLASNPLAVLAWIGEKFLEWSHHDPSLDTILEDVTLYWLTETFPRSIYTYRERFSPTSNFKGHDDPTYYVKKPLGYSWFPKEITPVPQSWVERTGNLVFYRQHPEGGHFAALEQPQAIMEDVEAFIQQQRTPSEPNNDYNPNRPSTVIATVSYVYSPVDSARSEIRLLTVLLDFKRVAGRPDAWPLRERLTHYYLPSSKLARRKILVRSLKLPVYYALSYVWGEDIRSQEILIDGKPLRITANIHAALRDIQEDEFHGSVHIWADAICVNQDDPEGKSAQIRLMRDIYHSATFVRLWLGPSSAETRRCLNFMARLAGGTDANVYIETDEISSKSDSYGKAPYLIFGPIIRTSIAIGQLISTVENSSNPLRDESATMILNPDEDFSLDQERIKELLEWRPKDRYLERVREEEDFTEVAALIDKTLLESRAWLERCGKSRSSPLQTMLLLCSDKARYIGVIS